MNADTAAPCLDPPYLVKNQHFSAFGMLPDGSGRVCYRLISHHGSDLRRKNMRPTAVEAALVRYPTIQVSRLALREGNCKRPIYTMHKWWARRLGAVFRMILLSEQQRKLASRNHDQLWSKFYSPAALPDGFTVLDPFLGGGTTLIEAAKQGARCIGVDIDPVACFITELELTRIDPKKIQSRFNRIVVEVESVLKPLYQTKRGGKLVDVTHFFWVDQVRCPACRKLGDAHPTYQLLYDTAAKKQTVVCPNCDSIATLPMKARWLHCRCGQQTDLKSPPVSKGVFTCPHCQTTNSVVGLCAEGMVTPRLLAIEYLTESGKRGFQKAGSYDRFVYKRAIRELKKCSLSLPLPKSRIPAKGRFDRRPLIYGIRKYRELFNHRQLLALGLVGKAVMATPELDIRRALTLALSHSLASNNMFCGWAFGYRRLTPLFGVHSYRKVTRPVEGNVLGLKFGRGSFRNAVRAVVRGYEYLQRPYEFQYNGSRPSKVDVTLRGAAKTRQPEPRVTILNRSSTNLSPIGTASVDLVLTDPPYFDNLSYSELSDFYHVWLRKLLGSEYPGIKQRHTPIGASLFGGRRKGVHAGGDVKQLFIATLTQVLGECKRVLRPEGALVFTFHHKSADAWEGLGKSLLDAGFSVEEVIPVRSEGRSGFHSYEGTIKWDSIFFCRPRGSTDLRTPTGPEIGRCVRRALAVGKSWTSRIRRSRFEFSRADHSSLTMSLVIREFSRRGFSSESLAHALIKAAGDGEFAPSTGNAIQEEV